MVAPGEGQVSPEFFQAVQAACRACEQWDDDAIAYAAAHVPVFAERRASPRQAKAAGCTTCMYLGLWADGWPGYGTYPHGIVWLFEDGIRQTASQDETDLTDATIAVLHHELEHALQREHVLDAMERRRVAR